MVPSMTSSAGAVPASESQQGAPRAEKKVAIVTGASRGIGAGIAAAFSAAGYAVVGTALSVEASTTPDVMMISGDIAQTETAERVVQQGLDRFGRIDTLVNNAGIYIGKPFTEYTIDDYVAITSVNLTGFFHMTQRAIAQMVVQGGGHIVNVSTSLVKHADAREPSALASLTKGGLEAVTRSLATEYAGRGVRVNAVALGIIETPLHDPGSYRELAGRHPLGRVGEVGDVVDGVLYLERAAFVTGATLRIDGGRAAGG
jgi:NAD(P)-dependent dehydrogenase (short-subunit alcohol dehydrogenase family)